MPVERVSSQQFADKLRAAILARTRRYDTGYGPILDLIINPVATVLEDQNNNRLRRVANLLSLTNLDDFTEEELNDFVFNEGLLRPLGSRATVTLTFQRLGRDFEAGELGTIPRGFPIATSVSEQTGRAVTFVTTEARDKAYAVAVPDSNGDIVYEVNVPAIALDVGSEGTVGSDRITRPLRGLNGYDRVTNKEPSQGGRDRYSNEELAELYLLAVAGRQLSVPSGLEFYARDAFPELLDIYEVFGSDPLLTRASKDAGAVDAYVLGESLLTTTETLTFLGVGQKMAISTPPLVQVQSVTRVSPSTTYEEGVDYEVAGDTKGYSGSSRGVEGIRFLPGADVTIGDQISIRYSYDQLIRTMQLDAETPEARVFGRDLLFKRGSRVDIYASARLVAVRGFEQESVRTLVRSTISNYVNNLKLGMDVEASDIQGVVRRITGVDNLVFTRLVRDPNALGVGDISISASEYARLEDVNLNITFA